MLKIGLTGSIACGKSFIAKLFAVYGVPIVDSDLIAREVVLPGSKTLNDIAAALGPEAIAADGTMNRSYVRQLVFTQPDKLKALNAIIHPAIRQRTLELCTMCAEGKDFPRSYNLVCAQTHALKAQGRDSAFCASSASSTSSGSSMSGTSIGTSIVYGSNGVVLDDSRTTEAYEATHQPLDPTAVLKITVDSPAPYIIVDIPLLFENHLEDMVDRILVVDAELETQVARIMARDSSSRELALSIINKQVSRDYRISHGDDIIATDIASIAEKRQHVLHLHRKYLALASASMHHTTH